MILAAVYFSFIGFVIVVATAPFWVPKTYSSISWPWAMRGPRNKGAMLVFELLHQPGWTWGSRHQFGSIHHATGVYISLIGDTCLIYPEGPLGSELKASSYWRRRVARACRSRLAIDENIDNDACIRRMASNIIAFAEKVRSIQQ